MSPRLSGMAIAKRSIIDFCFLTSILFTGLYFLSLVVIANLTSFQWQEGGALALTLLCTVCCVFVTGSYFGQLLGQLPFKNGYAPSNTVTMFQLPCFSYHNTLHVGAPDNSYVR